MIFFKKLLTVSKFLLLAMIKKKKKVFSIGVIFVSLPRIRVKAFLLVFN